MLAKHSQASSDRAVLDPGLEGQASPPTGLGTPPCTVWTMQAGQASAGGKPGPVTRHLSPAHVAFAFFFFLVGLPQNIFW